MRYISWSEFAFHSCFFSLNLLRIFSTQTILSSTSSHIAIVIHHNVITFIHCHISLKITNVIKIDSGTLSNVIKVSLPFIKKTVMTKTITIIASLNASVTLSSHSCINQSCLNKSVLSSTPSGKAFATSSILVSIRSDTSKVLIQGCFIIRKSVQGFPLILASPLRFGSAQNLTSATWLKVITHDSFDHTTRFCKSVRSLDLQTILIGASCLLSVINPQPLLTFAVSTFVSTSL